MSPEIILQEISISHFRNLQQAKLQMGPGMHMIAGKNGAGKTNLLDAIYYLCLTRSHFSYGDASAINHGQKWLRIAGNFSIESTKEVIALKIQPRKGKTVERNGSAYSSLIDHIGLLPAVMISPNDIELVIGGPEERRRFMDQTISQVDASYLKVLIVYNRLLKSRNAMLKAASHPLEIDLNLLATYDAQLVGPAKQIFETRAAFVEELEPIFQELYKKICGGAEQPGMLYQSKLTERPYKELLLASRDQDTVLRRTNVGPHRDELALTLDGEELRRFASQGQLKSVVLALRLAQARILRSRQQRVPILLLDDIFDRLDPTRVQQLIDLVQEENYAQVFITDTHTERLRNLEVNAVMVSHYAVVDGLINKIQSA